MDADLAALPGDIDALKAALTTERARMREVIPNATPAPRRWRWRGPRHPKTWP
jgi:hypothetical protein